MKTLLILRHAKSSWKDSDLDDHDRPLNKRGKRDAPRMGELLKEEDLLPDFIVTSSAKRARRTAECVALHSGYRGETRVTSALYAATSARIRQVVQSTPDSVGPLLLVGHNPGLEEFLEQISGSYLPLSSGALAALQLEIDSWTSLSEEVQGTLLHIWQPRELP
jgi:phosphohistidine phosphatase